MKRRTIVVLSFLSAVVSAIYVVSNYFGWNRYISMHLFSNESYIKNYLKLDKGSNKRTVISLDSKNPEKLKPTLNSLLDQTVRVDEIAINVKRGLKVPNEVKKIARVYTYDKTYKDDLGGIIPTILREEDADTLIIWVRDDMIYGKDMIETLLEQNAKDPDKVIGIKNINSKNGVLIKPKFFTDKSTSCSLSSESWISNNTKNSVNVINYSENYGRF